MENVKNKTWLGALASAIKALASTLINLFSVANEGISMAQQAVEVAREKQAIDLIIGKADYAANAVDLASMQQATVKETIRKFVGSDESRKKDVMEAHERLSKLVNQELAKIQADRATG